MSFNLTYRHIKVQVNPTNTCVQTGSKRQTALQSSAMTEQSGV